MRKVSTIIMALAVIMGMTQCTKPAMQLYDGSYTGVTKEITFSTGGSSKVTVDNSVLNELKFKWEDGDHLYVYGSASDPFSGGNYCGSLALVKGAGTENGFFSGTLDNVPTSGTLRFYYCPKELFDKEQETITVDLSTQDGSLEDVASHLVACADVTVKPDGGDYSATLAVPYSVVKFDLSAFGTTDITMTGTTKQCVTISGNGECTFTAATPQETTLNGAGANTYISVIPESGSTTLNFEGGGKSGSRAINLESNTFQTLNNGGDPVPVLPVETDEWINFNDPAMGVEGLPIWSKYNLGVDKSNLDHAYDWYGDYYAWGEVETYYTGITWTSASSGSADGWKDGKTAGYAWGSYKWCNGMVYTLTKYNNSYACGPIVDNKTILEASDDAARAMLCDTWRMPTGDYGGEWNQLASNTYCKLVYGYNGIAGLNGFVVYKVKAAADKGLYTVDVNYDPNNPSWKTLNWQHLPATVQGSYTDSDPHMFLPAAGMFLGTTIEFAGLCGYIFSSSRVSGNSSEAHNMDVGSGWCSPTGSHCRVFGLPVRPVR